MKIFDHFLAYFNLYKFYEKVFFFPFFESNLLAK